MSSRPTGSGFYIRYKGRVTGPFALGHLASLVRRGALSRAHELSTDSTNWRPADQVPGVFSGGDAGMMYAEPLMEPEVQASAPAEPAGAGMYYRDHGRTQGPVAVSVLEMMAGSGALRPDMIVWADGAPQSFPAQAHPMLSHLPWGEESPGDGGAIAVPARSGCGTVLILAALLLLAGGVGVSIWLSNSSSKKETPAGNVTAPGGTVDPRMNGAMDPALTGGADSPTNGAANSPTNNAVDPRSNGGAYPHPNGPADPRMNGSGMPPGAHPPGALPPRPDRGRPRDEIGK